jgi:hypothetical protein
MRPAARGARNNDTEENRTLAQLISQLQRAATPKATLSQLRIPAYGSRPLAKNRDGGDRPTPRFFANDN